MVSGTALPMRASAIAGAVDRDQHPHRPAGPACVVSAVADAARRAPPPRTTAVRSPAWVPRRRKQKAPPTRGGSAGPGNEGLGRDPRSGQICSRGRERS